jgi:hypothetical protein
VYLLYVDESGDTGLSGSPLFILSGLVVHELRWHAVLESFIAMRKNLRTFTTLKLREEVHAAHFVHAPGDLARIPKHMRLRILRYVLRVQAARTSDLAVLNVVVDKSDKPQGYDVFENAWRALIQRFENTIAYQNFPGPKNSDERGLLIVDRTQEKKLRDLVRRMRRYNPIPSLQSGHVARQMPLVTLVEDPVHRDSAHAYFIQMADVNAYFLMQREQPCGYVRRSGARNYFNLLNPILCKYASRTDPQGVVRL